MSLFKVRLYLNDRFVWLYIYFSSVPVPTPSISVSNTGTVYAGTLLSLTCDYNLSPSVDISPDIAVAWTVNGRAVDTTPDRISIDGATLSFSPVATSDSGRYTCELSVTASQTHVTAENSRQSTVDILIQSNTLQNLLLEDMYLLSFLHPVPQPDVGITLSRTAPLYTGGNLTLTCTVTTVYNSERVVIEWSGPRNISGERYLITPTSGLGTNYSSSLTITSLADQDDGTYTCNVTVTGTGNAYQATASVIIVMGE